jgi:hypothetical protein
MAMSDLAVDQDILIELDHGCFTGNVDSFDADKIILGTAALVSCMPDLNDTLSNGTLQGYTVMPDGVAIVRSRINWWAPWTSALPS